MKGYQLLLDFENTKNMGFVAALARIMDFPISNSDELIEDFDFWQEEIWPALRELFLNIQCYCETERAEAMFTHGKPEVVEKTLEALAKVIKEIELTRQGWVETD